MTGTAGDDLVRRWQDPAGQTMAAEVLERLATGQALAGMGLDVHDGRLDLRGIGVLLPLALDERRQPRAARAFGLERTGERPTVSQARLEHVDLSFADLSELRFLDTTIVDCRLASASLARAGFWRCDVQSSDFGSADLRAAMLGGTGRRTRWTDVSFRGADLRSATPAQADFVRCDFSTARLRKVEFYGSDLVGCVFSGPVQEVIFSATGLTGDPHVGRLEAVDFSGAVFKDSEFRGFDLEDVQLPGGPEHVTFRDYPCTLRRAAAALEGRDDRDDLWLLGLVRHEARWLHPAQRIGILAVRDLSPSGTIEDGEPRAKWLRELDAECIAGAAR